MSERMASSSLLSRLSTLLLSHFDSSDNRPSEERLANEYNLSVKYQHSGLDLEDSMLIPWSLLLPFMKSHGHVPWLTDSSNGISNGVSSDVSIVSQKKKGKFVTSYNHAFMLDVGSVAKKLRGLMANKRRKSAPCFVAVANTDPNNNSNAEEKVNEFFCHKSKMGSDLRVYSHSSLDVAELGCGSSSRCQSIFLRWNMPQLAQGFQSEDENDVVVYGTVICDQMDEACMNEVLRAIEQVRGLMTATTELYIQGVCTYDTVAKMNLGSLESNANLWLKSFNYGSNKMLWVLRSQGLIDPALDIDGSVLSSYFKRHPCVICKKTFMNAEALVICRRKKEHLENFCHYQYSCNRSTFLAPKKSLKFVVLTESPLLSWKEDVLVINADEVLQQDLDISFALANHHQCQSVIVRKLYFLNPIKDFEMSDRYGVTRSNSSDGIDAKTVRLGPGAKLDFKLTVRRSSVGQARLVIVALTVDGSMNEETMEVMGIEVAMRTTTEEMKELDATSEFEKIELEPSWRNRYNEIVPGKRLEFQNPAEKKRDLKLYQLDRSIGRAIALRLEPKEDDDANVQIQMICLKRLQKELLKVENYRHKLAFLLQAEEQQMQKDIRLFDMKDVVMRMENGFFYLAVPGLSENRPSVLRGDRIDVRISKESTSKIYEGFVHGVESERVKLGFGDGLLRKFTQGMKFDVQFHFNRYPMRLMHRAIEEIDEKIIKKFLFAPLTLKNNNEGATCNFRAINRKVEDNIKQKQAVQAILSMNNDRPTYVVYGPPGTGKTVTTVEAMLQLYKRNNHTHILACAPSNSAADILAQRLLSTVSNSDLLRFYAKSRDPLAIPDELKRLSNLNRPFMGLKDFLQYRVIVVTLCTAGALVTQGMPSNFFEYIFIDEAGQAMEPEALIPLAHMLDFESGKLVLVGDPKQLGPSIRNGLAKSGGLGRSMLERLMQDNPLFRPDKEGEFDSRFVTKLLETYRSHEDLLNVPSTLFYSSELNTCADKVITRLCCNWSRLPKKGFPLIFHSVAGVDKREAKSPSFFNLEEMAIVVDYVVDLVRDFDKKGVKADEIGIIAPYRRQVQKIREALRKKADKLGLQTLRKVDVGSVEEFQGQERKVIIISTVRSAEEFLPSDVKHKLGFVSHPKRFNVAITRARSLLIVVGNPIILKRCSYWKALINYIKANGGYTGKVAYSDDDDGIQMSSLIEAMKELDFDEKKAFIDISENELQEEPQWRADF